MRLAAIARAATVAPMRTSEGWQAVVSVWDGPRGEVREYVAGMCVLRKPLTYRGTLPASINLDGSRPLSLGHCAASEDTDLT